MLIASPILPTCSAPRPPPTTACSLPRKSSASSFRVLASKWTPTGSPKRQITSEVQPLLADPYAVISTASPFPKGKHCIRFPGPIKPSLDILPGNHLRAAPVEFKVEPFRVREQVKTSNWRMALEYADETGARLTTVELTLDSTATPPATLTMSPLNIVVDRDPFTALMRVVGKLEAKSPAAFTESSVVFGSMLAPVSEFITVMKDFGLPFAMAAAVVNGATWKQEIHIDLVKAFRFLFKLRRPPPEKDDDRINLGFCKFRGEINCGIFITPFGNRHAGFVFEIIGEFQQAIIGTLLYGGGYFRLEFEFEFEEEEKDGKKRIKDETKIELTAAAAGSLGGELIPKVLKGEANVRYGYLIELDLDNFPPKIKPGVIIGMEVEAEVLEGACGIGFEWEGKALMTRHESKIEIKAEVTAAATVTVAWYFQETIEIEGKFEYQDGREDRRGTARRARLRSYLAVPWPSPTPDSISSPSRSIGTARRSRSASSRCQKETHGSPFSPARLRSPNPASSPGPYHPQPRQDARPRRCAPSWTAFRRDAARHCGGFRQAGGVVQHQPGVGRESAASRHDLQKIPHEELPACLCLRRPQPPFRLHQQRLRVRPQRSQADQPSASTPCNRRVELGKSARFRHSPAGPFLRARAAFRGHHPAA